MIHIINKDEFLADLQEFLNDQEAILLDINEANEHLVNDKHQADYFIRLAKQKDLEMEEVKQFVEAERARQNALLDEYLNEQIRILENQKKFYVDALETYVHRELDGSNKRSIKLPHGTLALKKQQPHFTYEDADIIEWAKEVHPELVKTTVPEPKTTIDKKKLKEQGTILDGSLYIDGVEVPGVQIEIKDDAFSIK